MTPTPNPTEIRTMLEKAAKLIGYSTAHYWDGQHFTSNRYEFYEGPDAWNPATSAHDSAMLRIQAGIEFLSQPNEPLVDCWHDESGTYARVDYPPNPTTADKLQCELLAVLKCAAAIYDGQGKEE